MKKERKLTVAIITIIVVMVWLMSSGGRLREENKVLREQVERLTTTNDSNQKELSKLKTELDVYRSEKIEMEKSKAKLDDYDSMKGRMENLRLELEFKDEQIYNIINGKPYDVQITINDEIYHYREPGKKNWLDKWRTTETTVTPE